MIKELPEDLPDVDWSDIPYGAANLDEVWAAIWLEMGETGGVHQYKMHEDGIFDDVSLLNQTIYSDILKDMRETLEKQNIIRVEKADPTKGSDRKEWVIDE
jgi:hypothetical protein